MSNNKCKARITSKNGHKSLPKFGQHAHLNLGVKTFASNLLQTAIACYGRTQKDIAKALIKYGDDKVRQDALLILSVCDTSRPFHAPVVFTIRTLPTAFSHKHGRLSAIGFVFVWVTNKYISRFFSKSYTIAKDDSRRRRNTILAWKVDW